ncbi:hypothetical protein ACP4J4_20270 (plasmid) [Aureimonas ureilytica]|uniref:hypothetical protein n=1 Tax=Aureimonas ureilytica TaxID=401562 RepID=UPI003CFB7F74
MMGARLVIPDSEAFELKEIMRRTGGRVSESTLRRWNAKYGISRQAGRNAKHEFSIVAVVILQHGDIDALELLREWKRTDPRLAPYFHASGVSA